MHSFLSLSILLTAFNISAQTITVQQNTVTQWSYASSKTYNNPFRDVAIDILVETPRGNTMKIPGYWAGDQHWNFRFSSPETGTYTFTSICSDSLNKDLHHQKGKIRVIEYTGDNPLFKHGPVKVSAGGRYFEHYDGTPFLLLADQWWHGMTQRFRWPEDFQTLTADRKQKGFSAIGFAVGFPCDIEPFDRRGQNEAGDPWMDSTFTSINPAYFDLTDLRINHLVSQGLVPNVMGSWGYYLKWSGVDNMKAHYRYLIARYGAYPIIWTLCGEATLAYYLDMEAESWEKYKAIFRKGWSEVGWYLQDNDPFDHPVTVHPGPGIWDGKEPLDDMDCLDFIYLQSGHDGFHTCPRATEQVKKNLAKYPNMPVLHGEVCFEGMQGSSRDDVQRFLFWSNMLMGTAGFGYGVEGIWQFNTEEELFGASPQGNVWGNVPWQTAYHYPGSRQVGTGKKILEQFPWWEMKADNELVRSRDATSIYAPYCGAFPNGDRIIYLNRKAATWNPYTLVNLSPGANYSYQYIDPITGRWYEKIPFNSDANGEWTIPTPPVMQDFVLAVYHN